MLTLPFKLPKFQLGKLKLEKPKLELTLPTRTFTGIDVGTSSLKIVELSRTGDRIKLENYGEMRAAAFYEEPFRKFNKSTLLLSAEDIAKSIQGIFQEAKLRTRNVVFSIPDFSTFFTTLRLPPLTREELAQAIEYEARQHVPLPLADTTLDWQIISGRVSEDKQKGTSLGILLVVVPNEVVNQYQRIAELAGLNLAAIEAEVFSLARSAAGLEKSTIILVDVGAQSTTVSVIDKGLVKLSHSFDIGGNEFTKRISQALNVDYETAERVKKKQGLERSLGEESPELDSKTQPKDVLAPLIDLIIREIEKISRYIVSSEHKEPEKIILAGGSALLPGLAEYVGYQLKEEVVVADPFASLFYPPILEQTLKEMGPSWAVALGAAMRGLE